MKYLRQESAGVIDDLKAARYYRQLLKIIDKDIRLLESVSKGYVIPEHSYVNSLLPKIYRIEESPEMELSSLSAAEWKRRKEAEKAKYPPYMPEGLVYTAQDGTKMRSLSEVIIANYLLSLGITFVYELPLVINGKRIRPDFTILSPVDNKTVIIIEHQGAMESEQYQQKFIRSLLLYLGSDLVPNRDVFFTFNQLGGNPDVRQIDCILRIAFGFEAHQTAGH